MTGRSGWLSLLPLVQKVISGTMKYSRKNKEFSITFHKIIHGNNTGGSSSFESCASLTDGIP